MLKQNRLNQKELDFLFNELVPIQYENLKDSPQKENLKFIVEAHNIKNYTSFNEILESSKLSKEKYFNKALYDTINLFFDSKDKEFEDVKFKLLNKHKYDLLYLLNHDIFLNTEERVKAVYLDLLLKHLIQNIESIKDYRNIPSDNAGTAYLNNTAKNGLQSRISSINSQLNSNEPFHVTSTHDKNRLNVSKNLVTMYIEDLEEANLLVILNSMFNHQLYKIPFKDGEKEGFNQSFEFLNGLPTSKPQIIRSFMIKISLPYKNKNNINKSELCRIIKRISKTFFYDIVYDDTKGEVGKYKVSISPRYLNYHTFIRTSFEGNLIYDYDKKNEYHFLYKLSLNAAIDKYTNVLIEEGYEEITENKYYKPTMKKIFKSSILAL